MFKSKVFFPYLKAFWLYMAYSFWFFSESCEEALADCSSLAKLEIKRFHQQRLADFRTALIAFVEVRKSLLVSLVS